LDKSREVGLTMLDNDAQWWPGLLSKRRNFVLTMIHGTEKDQSRRAGQEM
jgi:hypothetical protein